MSGIVALGPDKHQLDKDRITLTWFLLLPSLERPSARYLGRPTSRGVSEPSCGRRAAPLLCVALLLVIALGSLREALVIYTRDGPGD